MTTKSVAVSHRESWTRQERIQKKAKKPLILNGPRDSHRYSLPLISSLNNQPLDADDASLLRARVAALEAELQGMRLSSMMMTATAVAAGADPAPAASSSASAASASASAASATSHDDDDQPTALVPRAALELLKLKDQAMDSVLEGITIADARRPDMPLIYVRLFLFSPPPVAFSPLSLARVSSFIEIDESETHTPPPPPRKH